MKSIDELAVKLIPFPRSEEILRIKGNTSFRHLPYHYSPLGG
jgi:hypothetical protein